MTDTPRPPMTQSEPVLTADEEHELREIVTLAGDDAVLGTDRIARLLATLDAARSQSPVQPVLSGLEAIAYIRERVRADSQAPDGRAWPGEIDDILDDATALATAPAADEGGRWQALIEAAPTEEEARMVYRLTESEWFRAALANPATPEPEQDR